MHAPRFAWMANATQFESIVEHVAQTCLDHSTGHLFPCVHTCRLSRRNPLHTASATESGCPQKLDFFFKEVMQKQNINLRWYIKQEQSKKRRPDAFRHRTITRTREKLGPMALFELGARCLDDRRQRSSHRVFSGCSLSIKNLTWRRLDCCATASRVDLVCSKALGCRTRSASCKISPSSILARVDARYKRAIKS